MLPNSSAICCDLHSPTCSSLLFRCPKCLSTRYVYKWIPLPPPPKIGVILSAPTAHLESVPPNSSAPHSFNGFHPHGYVCLPLPFTFHGSQNRKQKSPMWPYHPMVLPQDLNTHAWRASNIQPLLSLSTNFLVILVYLVLTALWRAELCHFLCLGPPSFLSPCPIYLVTTSETSLNHKKGHTAYGKVTSIPENLSQLV